jgi:iron only hydrogenase large subunit-like protein
LACPGGCVGGPWVISQEPIEIRAQKVKDYKEHSHHKINNPNVWKFKNAWNLDMCSRTVD